jgi:Chemotaxis phosphatase CheX
MYEEELLQVAQALGESMLQLDLVPTDPGRHLAEQCLSARVDISGAWNGCVITSCSEALARRMAGVLQQSEPGKIALQHVRDAFGEVTNMLGGGIKALFPTPSVLSLPLLFAEGAAAQPAGSERLGLVCLDCGGEVLAIELRVNAGVGPRQSAG